MRRWPSWLLVGALVALGAVAAADALRGSETREARPEPRAQGPAEQGAERTAGAMGGALFYSDAKDECRIHGLTLPDLLNAPPPKLRSCRFSLAPSGETALPGAATWSPHGGLYARETGDMIELGSPSARQPLRFPGRAPAFKPDGTFTYVRGNEVVEWTADCPRGSSLFTVTGIAPVRCRHVALSFDDLRRALPGDATESSVALTGLAWLSDSRLVAVVDVDAGGADQLIMVLERGRVVGTLQEFGESLRIEASPRGSFFTAWADDEFLSVRDRDGRHVLLPPFPVIRAFTWSPDERWTAIATEHSVYVFRTNEGEARVRRLAIVARDVAWR